MIVPRQPARGMRKRPFVETLVSDSKASATAPQIVLRPYSGTSHADGHGRVASNLPTLSRRGHTH